MVREPIKIGRLCLGHSVCTQNQQRRLWGSSSLEHRSGDTLGVRKWWVHTHDSLAKGPVSLTSGLFFGRSFACMGLHELRRLGVEGLACSRVSKLRCVKAKQGLWSFRRGARRASR